MAAACVLWHPAGDGWIAAGFAAVSAVAVGWLGATGRARRVLGGGLALGAALRGQHVRRVAAAERRRAHRELGGVPRGRRRRGGAVPAWSGERRWRWIGLAGDLGGRGRAGHAVFPRYYFRLLPVVVLMAARGFTLMLGRRRELVALLLLIPLTRFAPSYYRGPTDTTWRDIAMDNASRAAAAFLRERAHPGDTLFVWGYRPEIYVYSGLHAATVYLDSQPLTGVPADRHLTQSAPVETDEAARRRAELTRSRPTFVVDGLGLYNPRLAIGATRSLQEWLAGYEEIGRVGQAVIYRRKGAGPGTARIKGQGPGAGAKGVRFDALLSSN